MPIRVRHDHPQVHANVPLDRCVHGARRQNEQAAAKTCQTEEVCDRGPAGTVRRSRPIPSHTMRPVQMQAAVGIGQHGRDHRPHPGRARGPQIQAAGLIDVGDRDRHRDGIVNLGARLAGRVPVVVDRQRQLVGVARLKVEVDVRVRLQLSAGCVDAEERRIGARDGIEQFVVLRVGGRHRGADHAVLAFVEASQNRAAPIRDRKDRRGILVQRLEPRPRPGSSGDVRPGAVDHAAGNLCRNAGRRSGRNRERQRGTGHKPPHRERRDPSRDRGGITRTPIQPGYSRFVSAGHGQSRGRLVAPGIDSERPPGNGLTAQHGRPPGRGKESPASSYRESASLALRPGKSMSESGSRACVPRSWANSLSWPVSAIRMVVRSDQTPRRARSRLSSSKWPEPTRAQSKTQMFGGAGWLGRIRSWTTSHLTDASASRASPVQSANREIRLRALRYSARGSLARRCITRDQFEQL